ncbi:threonyl-tRNA synthetase [Panacagrimonas perspica]|uniref:Threonine--tRNA ligase n=1 Tax=Panacagrimonas perspica TaxID=381431 RepID=A0A4S3K4L6_9GAMM|nr:threonine--tRNA ligase [Panacagrimonas perspica]TDU25927.1 threonyl-tRNA synthetase [Panacagrimonas perspica]THD02714.1 threonine--tRNA ligase [Panacagrimonas perspica]
MSVNITFPDGNQKSFEGPVTGLSIAQGISPGLAKKAALVAVDGELWDLTRPIDRDATISIITRDKPEALETIRHDAAHVMAQAVQELFAGTQITFGPSTEYGFYYDFARAEPFTEADLEKIEQKMREIVKRDLPITREVWSHEAAVAHFEKAGEKFKAEWIRDGIKADETLTIYRQGDQWLDMCLGPHLPSTGRLGTAFKLTKVSGAYWRGDAKNAQLQRIYGLAFANDDELKAHLKMIEEAEKRDHRRLGRQLDLFHIQDEAIGQVFWHPKGWAIYRTLENYVRKQLDEAGYVEVKTPLLVDRKLWEESGHWENYRKNMFIAEVDEGEVAGVARKAMLAVKPMNCPCHVQIFKQGIRSYRDLPLRMAEFGACHRYEPSGALHGLMRVRGFVQDDAHIFCTEDQIAAETVAFCDLLTRMYKDLGFESVRIKFSDRPESRAGDDAIWDKAEGALRNAVEQTGLPYTMNPGEGAFYGPKLEFVLRDAIGRDWQCGTLQVDFVVPERLGAEYVTEDGSKKTPVMLHRAVLGSFERFIGILIEQHAGAFPMWLAPVQAVVAPIVSDADEYATKVCAELRKAGIRAESDLRNEKINYKIREHATQKIPVIVVVGRKEAEEGTVTLRFRGEERQETLPLAQALQRLLA